MKIVEHDLQPRVVAAVGRISREMAHYDLDMAVDLTTQDFVLRCERTIMAENTESSRHEWVEEPVWKDARAHYVASLPEGFRRRFLMRFWGLSEDDLVPKRVRHMVDVKRWVKLPDVPTEFGRAYYEQVLDELGGWA